MNLRSTERAMNYAESRQALIEQRRKLDDLRSEIRALQASTEPEPVDDYRFETPRGEIRLSQLFGDKRDLIVVHNMGSTCASCTMWADGFNGVYQHLAARAAFVVVSNDASDLQKTFADDRGWRFPMVSSRGTSFHFDMGYSDPDHPILPGVSVFRKDGDRVVRVTDADIGDFDGFCIVSHLFDLLPEGIAGFRPRFRYFEA
jgi:predicted dithiol-disulfide oxidoreductase (DUF899 family)